jgi:pimeloyl-ACP methyl ester carboxylesterase
MNIRYLIFLFALSASATHALAAKPYTLSGPNGNTVEGVVSYIDVPENRHVDGSKKIKLGFVKLPNKSGMEKTKTNITSTKKRANPIVYLSGGPGGSATWTARGEHFPLFVALSDITDVIVFDQRGTGLSRNNLQDCAFTPDISFEQPLTHETYLESMKKATAFCSAQWRRQGIDLNGYNTLESVHDLEALRIALGVEKIDLWAISYGTHLALAMAKQYPNSVGRMVLASAEGLDETIKLPSLSDQHLQRVAVEIMQDENARNRYPNLQQLMRDTLAQYRDNPAVVEVTTPHNGEKMKIGVGAFDIQLMTATSMTSDPDKIAMLPGFYYLLSQRDFSLIGGQFLAMRAAIWTLNPMSVAMDAASGISDKRWLLVQEEAKASLLGRAHNLPFPDINSVIDVVDLGNEFRSDLNSTIPTLFFSGTLDGRTFVESHRAIAAGFSNATFVTVNRGGHNLFMSSPEILTTMRAFYTGEKIKDFTIELPRIRFL